MPLMRILTAEPVNQVQGVLKMKDMTIFWRFVYERLRPVDAGDAVFQGEAGEFRGC